jgi:hypothetical protein
MAFRSAVHAFFYLWYGTKEFDGKWLHWDHFILPHWTPQVREQFPGEETRWIPPADIHAPFILQGASTQVVIQKFYDLSFKT